MTRKILSMIDVAACPDVLKPLAAIGEVVQLSPEQDLLLDRIHEFDAFATSLAVQSNRDVLDRARRLQVIATPSTGTDHIDVAEAQRRNIAVLSLKDDIKFLGKITATAELAWALLLSVVRRLPTAMAAARAGHWARDEFRGAQLSGKTLGVVGYGRLGTMVADYGKAFGMRVLVCDKKEVKTPPGVERTDFDSLLQHSDVVSIHVHLSDSTRQLFNNRAFQNMKAGAVLINTSRGAIIDESALLTALTTGHLAGAGLDLIDGEWRSDLDQHPLIQYANSHDNLLITPHIGGVTRESQSMAFERMVTKLVEFFETIRITGRDTA
jgi:D-3-phosphoglycerate dehydrogenase / 2-oxoglutarate reductase